MLMTKLPQLPAYGQNATQFFELLGLVIANIVNPESQTVIGDNLNEPTNATAMKEMVSVLLRALASQNLLLSNHPNSHIYTTLSSLLDFDGFYLESEPCLVCNDPGNRRDLQALIFKNNHGTNSNWIQFAPKQNLVTALKL